MTDLNWLVLGVDPAPSKTTFAFDGEEFRPYEATELRDELHGRVGEARKAGRPVLVLWDAPICMDDGSFYGRQVDTDAKAVVKRWMKEQAVGGLPPAGAEKEKKEKRAVGIAAAAQCPHNLLSMHVLGLPMGQPKAGLSLLTDPEAVHHGGAWVAEVHPAVAMGAFYARYRAEHQKLLRYKKSKTQSRKVLEMLLTRVPCVQRVVPEAVAQVVRSYSSFGDDQLDAFMAWVLGRLLLVGEAQLWRGLDSSTDPSRGYYLMPRTGMEGVLSVS